MTQQQLEAKVVDLERQVTALAEKIQPLVAPDAWQETFGSLADDPGIDEVLALGREFRSQQNAGGD